MNSEINRVRNDIETIEKALGMGPSFGQAWLTWMRAQKWLSLWLGIPGLFLIVESLLPLDRTQRYAGLRIEQWSGILVALMMMAFTVHLCRKVSAKDGKPDALIRELKRVHGLDSGGVWFGGALAIELVLYALWSKQNGIAFGPFWAGGFVLVGSSFLLVTAVTRTWTLLGWGIPFIAYGFGLHEVGDNARKGIVLMGGMFLAIALLFSLITTLQIWTAERHSNAH